MRPGTGGELARCSEAQIPSETYQVERGGAKGKSVFLPGEISGLRGLEKSAEAIRAMKSGNADGAKGRRRVGRPNVVSDPKRECAKLPAEAGDGVKEKGRSPGDRSSSAKAEGSTDDVGQAASSERVMERALERTNWESALAVVIANAGAPGRMGCARAS